MKTEFNGTDEFLAAVAAGRTYFSDCHIKGVTIRVDEGVTFRGIDFRDAWIEECRFDECEFIECAFHRARFNSVVMNNCMFHSCDFIGTKLKHGYWEDCTVADTNLTQASFEYFNAAKCKFYNCNMHGVNSACSKWRGCQISKPRNIKTNSLLPDLIHGRIDTNQWPISFTDEYMQIGCQLHVAEAWFNFNDQEIAAMHKNALDWWRIWKPALQALVEAKLSKREKTMTPLGSEKRYERV